MALKEKTASLKDRQLEREKQMQQLIVEQAQLQDEVVGLTKEREELMQSSSWRPHLFSFSNEEAQSSKAKEVYETYDDNEIKQMIELTGFPSAPFL
jgi:predicted sugar kinase